MCPSDSQVYPDATMRYGAYRKCRSFIMLYTPQSITHTTTCYSAVTALVAHWLPRSHGHTFRRNENRYTGFWPTPINVTVTKGAVHIIATRGFVDFAMSNETALKFLEWVKKTKIPDETYFSTLNHNPQLGAPGSYRGKFCKYDYSMFQNLSFVCLSVSKLLGS